MGIPGDWLLCAHPQVRHAARIYAYGGHSPPERNRRDNGLGARALPRDAFALAGFDGSCLYEHEDPRLGANPDWGTLCFNYGRSEVANFLLGSALAWLDRFHIDGLRFDAVASMLYLNFSRESWIPNKYGGSENIEAIEFLKRVNEIVHSEHAGAITVAEESTTFAGVTKPVAEGGLGFDFKWNLGWMHDTLDYLKEDPINRKYHHNNMTFPSMFQFTEKFMLVYSHDEVCTARARWSARWARATGTTR